jgi:ribonuclease III
LDFVKKFFTSNEEKANKAFDKKMRHVLGFKPKNKELFEVAMNHKSMSDKLDRNNERLEYLGDAILGSAVAEYLYKKYPYKGEGFLTEMRSKMVNRQRLNEIGLKIGLKTITNYNKQDNGLRMSHIFGNALEALIGAVYIEKGYEKTCKWLYKHIILPHFVMDELELVDINIKNKLYGWASKHGKILDFVILEENKDRGRRLFLVAATIDGEIIAEGKAFNKKDASQIASKLALEKLGLLSEEDAIA